MTLHPSDRLPSTQRFSDRVENYVRYRPDYPAALLEWLHREHGVSSSWQVADIGAGTGISSKLFLDAGHRVVAVEPNAPMRAAAEHWLADYPTFHAVDGSADASGLDDHCIDLISVAQAFHWFDPEASRREFRRILRPHGLAAIYWNSRRLLGTPFLQGYEALLRNYSPDYASVAEKYPDEAQMRAWFGEGFHGTARFNHSQWLDFDALRGRLMSSSYAPQAGHINHEPMLYSLRELFDACAEHGHISFDYDTCVYVGKVA
ncbi:class I SAM-dependent methyltransferase [Dyella silvatica]|uniref:class I SAM-dependent methyltransferase n=1 Tax=Dyella silvatica TaxID=2992128 RepID=UPI00224FF8B5|nr:class I SAM-dependent methyltransferase [Dyella silvatica]